MTWMPPRPPAWATAVLAEVEVAFGVTGSATPGWPDPHPDLGLPADEEYSRCSDPGKYRILGARVEAWVQVLADRDLAMTRDLGATGPWADAVRPPEEHHRVRQILPRRPGALGLLVADTLVEGAPFGLDVGVISPAPSTLPVALVDSVPTCGCDACDDGSDRLLEELDGVVLTVACGGVVHARRGDDVVTRTPDGWSGSGRSQWLDPARSFPDSVQRWRGQPWQWAGAGT